MKIPPKFQKWIEARKRFKLSHAHIQMARELGMNPDKFGKIANHKQESWKVPLPQFIEHCYFKQFGKDKPEAILSIEEVIKYKTQKKLARKEAKMMRITEQRPESE